MKKITFNSPVILSFVLASGIVLAAGFLTGGVITQKFFCVYKGSFTDPLLYLRLFTHVLGHASWSHNSNNMILILLVGPMLEEKYGSGKLAAIIAAVALITGVVHIFLPSDTALMGASGIVFAFILLASVTGTNKGIPATLIIVAVIYISQEVYNGVILQDNISQLTHIIGGCMGAIFGMALRGRN